jgi:FeS assembly protein IscX
MKWTDTQQIAEDLFDKYPEINPATIRFTDLMAWTMALDGFDDVEERCGEKILEAIQLAWIEEFE